MSDTSRHRERQECNLRPLAAPWAGDRHVALWAPRDDGGGMSRRALMLGAAGATLISIGRAALAAPVPVVAAAADLDAALPEIAAAFTKETGRTVRLTFGSSGNLTQQVRQGAPYQLLLSADEGYIRLLAKEGLTQGEGVVYAIGRIGIFVPTGSPLRADPTLRDLAAGLADGRVKRFAIANPAHAPYGRAAEEALRHAGLWDKIHQRLVLGENVAQATQFAASLSAQGGIIPLSAARTPSIAARGTFALIPESWHTPLRQRMALVKGAGETARLFYAYLQEPSAQAVFARFGFALPGATS